MKVALNIINVVVLFTSYNLFPRLSLRCRTLFATSLNRFMEAGISENICVE